MLSRLASLIILFRLRCHCNVSFSRSWNSSAVLIWSYNLKVFFFLTHFWWFFLAQFQLENLYSLITFSYSSLVISLEYDSSVFATSGRFCNPKPPIFTGSAINALSTYAHIWHRVIAGIKVILMFFRLEVSSRLYQVLFARKAWSYAWIWTFMQNKRLVVEFLLSLKVFLIDLSMTVLCFRDILLWNCTKMSSSLFCDLDVTT